MSRANDPQLHSWIQIPPDSEFPIQNLPFGIFSTDDHDPRVGVAIGDYILDLCVLGQDGLFDLQDVDPTVFHRTYLNDFISLGKPTWRAVRDRVSELLRNDNDEIRDNTELMHRCLVKQTDATMHLPLQISNYSNHITNLEPTISIGTLSDEPDERLSSNLNSNLAGYQGQTPFITISGTSIVSSADQVKHSINYLPAFNSVQQLNLSPGIGFVSGSNIPTGTGITTTEADHHIFGQVLCCHWTINDNQRFEESKPELKSKSLSIASISPWVVTLDALEPFRVSGPEPETTLLPYLEYIGNKHFNIDLCIYLQTANQDLVLIRQTNTRYLNNNINQQLAHLTSSGTYIQVGDLITTSYQPNSLGSLLELAQAGNPPLLIPDGSGGTFLETGGSIIFKGGAVRNGLRIGFGEVRIKILPAG